jgi:hypothetical protein
MSKYKIRSTFDFWFPVRWKPSSSWYEIKNIEIFDGYVNVLASKDENKPIIISFNEDEYLGDSPLTPSAAKDKLINILES